MICSYSNAQHSQTPSTDLLKVSEYLLGLKKNDNKNIKILVSIF